MTPSWPAKACMPLFPTLFLRLAGGQRPSTALLHQSWVEQPSSSTHYTWCVLSQVHTPGAFEQPCPAVDTQHSCLEHTAVQIQLFPLTMLQFLGSTHWKCRATWRMASRRSATSSVCLMFLAFSASRSSSPGGAHTARRKVRKGKQV